MEVKPESQNSRTIRQPRSKNRGPKMETLCEHLNTDLAKFTSSDFLTSDMSIPQARALFLKNSIQKKFQDASTEAADKAAVALFLQCNDMCRDFVLDPKTSQQYEVIGHVKQAFWERFSKMSMRQCDFTYKELYRLGNVGPGANRGAASYNFYTKLFDSGLSATSDLLHSKFRSLAYHHNDEWYRAEMQRYHMHGDEIVSGSLLSTVAKNINISRTICTEPTLNMYFQKGVGKVLEQLLFTDHLIDLSKQPDKNRLMAKEGSITHKFATIDLSSASDTISLNLMRELLPIEFFELLQALRSPTCQVGQDQIKLNMLSSMGNGFTFPLQTYLFATVVVACYQILGIKPVTGSEANYSVFGDDIIVLNDAFNFVSEMLQLFGFKVNTEKSFSTGDFRESCGEDYFRGHNIRGFYIKSLKTRFNINAAFNGLLVWQCRSGIYLEETMRYLLKFRKNSVPLYEDPSSGYYATSSRIGKTYKKLIAKPSCFEPQKLPYSFKANESGLLISFLGGYVRRGRITLRSRVPTAGYRTLKSLYRDDLYYTKRIFSDACPSWYSMMGIIEATIL